MKIAHIDSFTNKPFSGNPAAVCILDTKVADDIMQRIAYEIGLSETAFLLKEGIGYQLRWFTPKTEVTLCGHATLASAHFLWEEGYLNKEREALFYTLSGPLKASKYGGWIHLDFPLISHREVSIPSVVIEGLGVMPLYCGITQLSDYLLEVESEDILKGIKPDFDLLKKVDARGIIVTCRYIREDYDFISRYFAPSIGINEDPVTGSAHCALAPFWGKRLDKTELMAFQASKRGGSMGVSLASDRVTLKGEAVTIWKGEVLI